jgi:hypothetical protein
MSKELLPELPTLVAFAGWASRPVTDAIEDYGQACYEAGRKSVDLSEFAPLARWLMNCTGHGVNERQRKQGERLLAIIDGDKK